MPSGIFGGSVRVRRRASWGVEAKAVSLVNKVIALADNDRAAYPELFQGLASATAKHRAKLRPAT